MYKYGVVIPTLGRLSKFDVNFENIIQTIADDTIVVVVVNPLDVEESRKASKLAELAFKKAQIINERNIELKFLRFEEPLGFGGANNEGYLYLKSIGLPEYVIFCNDDVSFFDSEWQQGLSDAIETKEFCPTTQANIHSGNDLYSIKSLGSKVGYSSAISTHAYGCNNFNVLFKNLKNKPKNEFDRYNFCKKLNKDVYPCTICSGFLICLSREFCSDIEEGGLIFDEENFPVGGYEDDDLFLRALNKNWVGMINPKIYVSHINHSQSINIFDTDFGTKNLLNFMMKHKQETQRPKTIAAAYRVKLRTYQDMLYFKGSLQRSQNLFDKVVVLLTDDVTKVAKSISSLDVNKIDHVDRNLLFCNKENYESELESWFKSVAPNIDVVFEIWQFEQMNELVERNKVIDMVRESGEDYMFSLDHDEIIEERITRELLNKITTHPNPNVLASLVTWSNLWEGSNVVRKDFPIDDGGKLTGGMLGTRFFKVDQRNIVGGSGTHKLHCGPTPDFQLNKRSMHSNITLKHYGMFRSQDRDYKSFMYTSIDDSKDPNLIGQKDYSHINKQDYVKVSRYSPNNGIGITMLCYEKEKWQTVIKWFNNLHTVCDVFVLTWTGEWSDQDKEWINKDFSNWPSKKNWYKTGPCYELAQGIKLFKIHVLHYMYTRERGFADVRNHGIDYLRAMRKKHPYMRWGMFLDPDEDVRDPVAFQRAISSCAKMNEVTGFLFKYENYTSRNSEPSFSESIRMFRLDLDFLRLESKVHESFVPSLQFMKENNVKPVLLYLPITLMNTGLLDENKDPTEKLQKYCDLLVDQINEDPLDSGAWTSLGLQFYNDMKIDEAVLCFERGVLCAGEKYIAFEQLALHYMRMAKDFAIHTVNRLPTHHPKYKSLSHFVKIISELKIDMPIVECGSMDCEIPSFPYEKVYNEFAPLISERKYDKGSSR